MRVLDFGVDKYGLDAYIYDSTDDGTTNYDRVLFARGKDGAAQVADLSKADGFADVKVTVAAGGALNGLTAGMLIKVEELNADASQVRLFHTSVTRANATWPGWPGEPGFTGDFAEFVAQTFPTSTAGDFAILEAGIVSEETYVEQGLYWETGHHPLLEYMIETYEPDLALVGYPVTDEFQHQFLGLVTPTVPDGSPNPGFDDVLRRRLEGRPGCRARGLHPARIRGRRRARCGWRVSCSATRARSRRSSAPTTASRRSSSRSTPARCWSTSGCCRRRRPRTAGPATGETIGKAKACWAGGAVQIYLNLAGRNPAGGGCTQVAAARGAGDAWQRSRPPSPALTDPNDWDGDGQPEGWKVIDRIFTQAEARYIPNGPGTTTDMAHPTRTGDLVAFSYPPYQYDGATPGTLIAKSEFFGQHGYVPDVQDLADNVNMRATFLAGGQDISRGRFTVRSIDIAPTIAYLLRRSDAAALAGSGADGDHPRRQRGQAGHDHRAQRLPRPARPDDDARWTG